MNEVPKHIESAAETFANEIGRKHYTNTDGCCDLDVCRIHNSDLGWEYTAGWLGEFYRNLVYKGYTWQQLPEFVAVYNVTDAVVVVVGTHTEPKADHVCRQWVGYAFEFTEMGASLVTTKVLGETR